ncbi:MAG: hypothetical protein J5507_06685 [Clostridia bacterium]|nr:hypothetical protein [Clostridia bacterium]
MILDIFNNLINGLKKNEDTQNFLNELKEEVDNPKNDNLGILEKIQSENKVSIGTRNKMEAKMEAVLKEYSKETSEKGELFYIVEKIDNEFVVYKYNDLDENVLKIKEDELPENTLVNSALRFKDNEYILDEEASCELQTRITTMANELLDQQNKLLEDYRKEGHLYEVRENINGSVFLHDITDNPSFEVEEVDFPEELLNKAIEGTIFEYIEGEYKLKGEEE